MNLDALEIFANNNGFDLTQPLDSDDVVRLAEHWLPQIRFHWKERFHPIGLNEAIEKVEAQFADMSLLTRESFKVDQFVKSGAIAVSQTFDPPLVTVPTGGAPLSAASSALVRTVKVLTESMSPTQALASADVDRGARVTHGGSETRSRRFFGAAKTVLGADVPSPEDPLIPAGDQARITIMASFKNLLETLEYDLLTEDDSSYPPDQLRKGFDVANAILRRTGGGGSPPGRIPRTQLRTLLLAMIAAHKNGDSLPALPPGITLDKQAWDALTRYAFLEYSFYYAYNDFERYQTAIFDNEHEGDDEGCCLVFDRNLINLAVASGDSEALLMAQPHSIITSVHEEYQDADSAMIFPTPVTPPVSPADLRDTLDPTVWVAGGSHATYLGPGTHDLVDFGDYLGWVNENAPWLWIGAPAVLVIAILLHILEHFIDTKDFTSDDGIQTGPGADPSSNRFVEHRIMTLPMSGDNHVYENRGLLTLLAYPGLWGDNDGLVDKSPPFKPKTGRFFRKLLDIT